MRSGPEAARRPGDAPGSAGVDESAPGPGDPPPAGRIAGLILAAGLASRMEGEFKLLLPYGDRTVVRAVADAAAAAGLDPVVAVVGHRAAEVRRALRGTRALDVENPAYPDGVGGSLAVGVRALAGESDVIAAAVLLGDEPGIRASAIGAAVEAWREAASPVLRTVYRDRPGHPVIFARSAFPLLLRLRGDRGPAELLASERPEVARLELDLEAPVDVDTPGAYEVALARAER